MVCGALNQRLEEYGPLGAESLQLKRGQPTVGEADGAREVPRMKFRVEVISVNDEGSEQRRDVMEMERDGLAVETLGLSLAEGKAILRGVQDFVASQQTSEDLRRRRRCPNCGQRHHSKAVAVPNPRWEYCSCQTEGPKTFRPTATWLQGRTSPERLYLESKWGSLIAYEKVADLLKEVLPVSESTNHEMVRQHLQAVAERIEAELGEEP